MNEAREERGSRNVQWTSVSGANGQFSTQQNEYYWNVPQLLRYSAFISRHSDTRNRWGISRSAEVSFLYFCFDFTRHCFIILNNRWQIVKPINYDKNRETCYNKKKKASHREITRHNETLGKFVSPQ